jgi:hypothetical protein
VFVFVPVRGYAKPPLITPALRPLVVNFKVREFVADVTSNTF